MAKTVGDFLGFGLEILFFLCYTTPSDAGLVYRYYSSFPSWLGGFDSRTLLHIAADCIVRSVFCCHFCPGITSAYFAVIRAGDVVG